MKWWKVKGYLGWAWSTWLGLLHGPKYCEGWDTKLNEMMDKEFDTCSLSFNSIYGGNYNVIFNDTRVWIANKYYSYGFDSDVPSRLQYRPSISTMVKLNRLVEYLKEQDRVDYR